MSAHTPGPWRAEGRDIRQGQENLIAQVARQIDNSGGDDPIRNANARLIAAAPAMLETLERVTTIAEAVAIHEASVRRFDWDNIVAQARAAIAQAKGDKARAILRDVEEQS